MTQDAPAVQAALTDEEVAQFLATGLVVVDQCFDPADPAARVGQGRDRPGVDPEDPGTWDRPRVHLPPQETVDVARFAPRALAATLQLLGGPERAVLPWERGDGFIADLGVGADRPFDPPSASVGGWHKDGDFFRHFLDSPEQGLLTFVLWTDVVSRGGGTFVATDSVGVVARHLAEHPAGLLPEELQGSSSVSRCRQLEEITASAGDVGLVHPFVLHATSQKALRAQRLITNPPITLAEPMDLDREDPADVSSVERVVLDGLGVDRYAFRPTAPRQAITVDRG